MEIKAKELRLGNLLLLDNEIRVVSSLHNDNTIRFEDKEKGSIGCFKATFTNIKPIELTEEILLKCKKNSIFNNGFTYKETSTGRFEIYVGMSLITVIEFLHELQNLNFALLGEEVIIEL